MTVPDDTDVAWQPMHDTIMERGFVYVAVAAQRLAIEFSPIALKQYDPVRYGTLSHPGDDFSFDMYSQAAEAVLDPIVLDDLRPLVTRRLAVGASQSGGRLKTYINDWAKTAGVFDGFMPQISGPDGVKRDLVPVLWLNSQSEIDADTVPSDSGLFRLWEMVGSAHAPHAYSQHQNSGYVFHETNGVVNIYDNDEAGAWGYQKQPGDCLVPNIYNPGYIYWAALVALDNWVTGGVAPPGFRANRADGALHYDDVGNMVGGMRIPIIDVANRQVLRRDGADRRRPLRPARAPATARRLSRSRRGGASGPIRDVGRLRQEVRCRHRVGRGPGHRPPRGCARSASTSPRCRQVGGRGLGRGQADLPGHRADRAAPAASHLSRRATPVDAGRRRKW